MAASEYIVSAANLRAMADAIREKTGQAGLITPNQMAAAIAAIPGGGGGVEVEPLSVTENGTYTAPAGKAFSPVTVDVPTGLQINLPNHINPATGEWERPFDWPDLDRITFPADFDGVYLTYDLRKTPDYGWIGVKATITNSASYTVERGHLSGEAFVSDDSYSVNSGTAFRQALDSADGNVQLWRVTAESTIKAFGFTTNSATQAECLNMTLQPCVEVRGRLKNLQTFTGGSGVNPNSTSNGTAWTERYAVSIRDGITDMASAFFDMASLQSLDVSDWVVAPKTLDYAFQRCRSLRRLDLSNWDVSNMSSIAYAFNECWCLQSLDIANWDVSNVVNMTTAFDSCYALTDIDLSNWDVSKVGSFYSLFQNCLSLKAIGVEDWDTKSVTNLQNAFRGCMALQELDLHNWDVSKVTTINSMTAECRALTSLDVHGWDLSSITNVNNMLNLASALVYLNASGVTLTVATGLDANKPLLTDYYPFIIDENQRFDSANLLTRASLLRIIDSLPEVSSTKTLTLGQTNKNKLTAAEIAAATEKGWTVA